MPFLNFLKPIVSHLDGPRPICWEEQFGRQGLLEVEIGFGLGEFLIQSAKENPAKNFIGIEQNWERIFKALKTIALQPPDNLISNVRILEVDARIALERLFSEKTIENIYCLFPCPWPKKKHEKHRLFSQEFFQLANSRLKDDGQIKIVTDFNPYQQWILEQIDGCGFKLENKTIEPKYNTKFERKWREAGQEKFFELDVIKVKHIFCPVKEDVALKAYRVKEFDPRKFKFCDQKGETSVLFKDMIFDEGLKRAMVRLVVAEEHLTQHIWVEIYHEKEGWHIHRADGQKFFPTPGIHRAIQLVYESASAPIK